MLNAVFFLLLIVITSCTTCANRKDFTNNDYILYNEYFTKTLINYVKGNVNNYFVLIMDRKTGVFCVDNYYREDLPTYDNIKHDLFIIKKTNKNVKFHKIEDFKLIKNSWNNKQNLKYCNINLNATKIIKREYHSYKEDFLKQELDKKLKEEIAQLKEQ